MRFCATCCPHQSCWDVACPYLFGFVPVITVEPVTAELRQRHGLPAEATAAVVERFDGKETVCCTDLEARGGMERAARAWARQTGAAYDWAA